MTDHLADTLRVRAASSHAQFVPLRIFADRHFLLWRLVIFLRAFLMLAIFTANLFFAPAMYHLSGL
ncbi:hypothetical protein D0O09_32295, partial [Pseudomonas putida]